MLDLNSKFQCSNPRTICRNIYDQAKVPTTQFEINGNFRRPYEDLNSTDRVVYGLLKYIEEAEKYYRHPEDLPIQRNNTK